MNNGNGNGNGMARFIGQHPDPQRFVLLRQLNQLRRSSCRAQVFTNLRVAQNFARSMNDRGLFYTVVPRCHLCGKIHVIGGL